jgi:hypothetical protein
VRNESVCSLQAYKIERSVSSITAMLLIAEESGLMQRSYQRGREKEETNYEDIATD